MNSNGAKINNWGSVKYKVMNFLDKDSEKIEPSPRSDWVIIIVSFLILAVFLMFFYRFIFMSPEDYFGAIKLPGDPEISIENISRAKLEKTLAPWKDKETKFKEYFDNRPAFDFLK